MFDCISYIPLKKRIFLAVTSYCSTYSALMLKDLRRQHITIDHICGSIGRRLKYDYPDYLKIKSQ